MGRGSSNNTVSGGRVKVHFPLRGHHFEAEESSWSKLAATEHADFNKTSGSGRKGGPRGVP
jgi:hypothetical protein